MAPMPGLFSISQLWTRRKERGRPPPLNVNMSPGIQGARAIQLQSSNHHHSTDPKCDLEQATELLWVSVSPSAKWGCPLFGLPLL